MKYANRIPLDLLRDPLTTTDPLEYIGNELINPKTGQRYPVHDGLPYFAAQVEGKNLKFQKMYNRLAIGYDLAEGIYQKLTGRDYRGEYIAEVEAEAGKRVLEVSVGTGSNLHLLPRECEFYGLDLTPGMLARCRANLERWRLNAALVQGEAERLPFADDSFDCVFHVGGINFFNDREAAICEMIRVARPGTKIVIVDETEKIVEGSYRKNPFIRGEFKTEKGVVTAPLEQVPAAMTEMACKLIFEQRLYCITFRKPA
jgi:ubiquinone/menaquinone biosynthesis C-methylase UbiE